MRKIQNIWLSDVTHVAHMTRREWDIRRLAEENVERVKQYQLELIRLQAQKERE